MQNNNVKGRRLVISIGVYFIIKTIVNMILGSSVVISDLFLAAAAFCFLYTGLQFVNIIVAVITGIVVIKHFRNNISNLGNDWRYIVYLAEAVVDVICCVLLLTNKNIKEFFSIKWIKSSK